MKLLVSFALGPHVEYLKIVQPGFRDYARRHGYAPIIIDDGDEQGLVQDAAELLGWGQPRQRPASWLKLPWITQLFRDFDAEVILWIDADIAILDPRLDIAEELGRGSQGLVFHYTRIGPIPNCGLWLLRREMVPVLHSLWHDFALDAVPWWEQGAMIAKLGADPNQWPVCLTRPANRLLRHTTRLRREWNWFVDDNERVAKPFFAHATQLPDRAGMLRRWVETRKL